MLIVLQNISVLQRRGMKLYQLLAFTFQLRKILEIRMLFENISGNIAVREVSLQLAACNAAACILSLSSSSIIHFFNNLEQIF